jgi:hypothetical protein
MVTYSHVICIDEPGNSPSTNDRLSNWVSAAIAVVFDKTQVLDDGIHRIPVNHLSPHIRQLKESFAPRFLQITYTIFSAAAELGDLLHVTVWGDVYAR